MFERFYRQRLEEDLTRWHAEGLIPSASVQAIRGHLPPISPGITVATMIGIVGGLLIAAAFLAFVAANWIEIARPARFAILIAGIAGAYGLGAWFDRTNRDYLADLSVGVGSIVFGAAIALVGQMYHLGDDFARGMFLWAAGALVAAALTGSRSALAVALAAACVWSGARVSELSDAHFPLRRVLANCGGIDDLVERRGCPALGCSCGACVVGGNGCRPCRRAEVQSDSSCPRLCIRSAWCGARPSERPW
jgi:uncharacterized membrane protein